jgi:hypothetical protein
VISGNSRIQHRKKKIDGDSVSDGLLVMNSGHQQHGHMHLGGSRDNGDGLLFFRQQVMGPVELSVGVDEKCPLLDNLTRILDPKSTVADKYGVCQYC